MVKRHSHHPIVRDIALVLVFKAVALTLLYVAFFGPAARIDATPARVAAAVLDSGPAPAAPEVNP